MVDRFDSGAMNMMMTRYKKLQREGFHSAGEDNLTI